MLTTGWGFLGVLGWVPGLGGWGSNGSRLSRHSHSQAWQGAQLAGPMWGPYSLPEKKEQMRGWRNLLGANLVSLRLGSKADDCLSLKWIFKKSLNPQSVHEGRT